VPNCSLSIPSGIILKVKSGHILIINPNCVMVISVHRLLRGASVHGIGNPTPKSCATAVNGTGSAQDTKLTPAGTVAYNFGL
jgi:hypothetical protein